MLASIWKLPVVYEGVARAMVSGAQHHGAGGSFRYIEDMASKEYAVLSNMAVAWLRGGQAVSVTAATNLNRSAG